MISCKSFENRLDDYIHGELADGFRAAMEIHISECESCKKICEEEMKIYNEFKSYFNQDIPEFKSLRSEVLKKIDRDRYSGKLVNKVQLWIRKNAARYFVSAAVLLLAIIGATNLFNLHKADQNGNYRTKGSMESKSAASKVEQNIKADMTLSSEDKQKNAISRFGGKPIEKIEKNDMKSMDNTAFVEKSISIRDKYFDGEFYYEVDDDGNIFSVLRKDVPSNSSKSIISDKEAIKKAESIVIKLASEDVINKLSKEMVSYTTEVKKLAGEKKGIIKGYSIVFKGKNIDGKYLDGSIYVEIGLNGQLMKVMVYIEDEEKFREELFDE